MAERVANITQEVFVVQGLTECALPACDGFRRSRALWRASSQFRRTKDCVDYYELANGCQGGARLMDVEAREAFHEQVCHQKRQFMLSIEEKGEGEIPGMLDLGV